MNRKNVKLLSAVLAVLLVLQGFDAARVEARCYIPFWQRGPVRRTVAFVFAPWYMAWRQYAANGPYVNAPGYGGYMVDSGYGPDYSGLAQSGDGSLTDDIGALVLDVPVDSKVYINGNETLQAGTQRKYYSRGLTRHQRYQYDVQVVSERDGRRIEESKTVFLAGGHRSELEFDPPERDSLVQLASAKSEKVDTLLKLRVPADAKVILVGTETTMQGEDRSYLSTELPEGEHWEGYTIRAEVMRDGRLHVAERKITLTGGETREVKLDFAPVSESN